MPSVLSLLLSAAAVVATLPPPFPPALPPPLPSAPPPWVWPLDGPHVVVRPFMAPASPYGRGHRGADLAAPAGAPVRAPAAGVVHFAGVVVDRPVLSIRHDDGVLSSYEPVRSGLERGDAVRAGDVIGTLLPGHCANPCLHLGVRVLGQYVSPVRYLAGIPRSVLIPTRR